MEDCSQGEACWTVAEFRGDALIRKLVTVSDELTAKTVAAALAEVESEARGQSGAHESADGKWFTREAVEAAFDAAVGEVTRIVGEDCILDIIPGVFAGEMNALPVSRDQALAMFNNAADTCKVDYNPEGGETTDSIQSDSVGDLIVNLAIGLLGNPGHDTDVIIAESWADLSDVNLDEFQVWNQDANGYGDYCPYSGQHVTPASREQLMTGLDPADERCPQGCPGSYWTDPERGTDAHTAAIVATVKGWVA